MSKKPLPLWLLEAPLIVLTALIIIPIVIRLFEVFGLSRENSIILSMLFQQFSFLIGTLYLKKKYPIYPEDILESKLDWKAFWRSLLWLPAILLISILGTTLSTQLFAPLLGPEKLQSILVQETTRVSVWSLNSWRLVLAGFIVCLVGPVSEELFFRGFFFSRVTHTYSKRAGYILTSLFFALPHFYLINSIPIFLLSLILCYMALNENIWAAVGAHVFFNTTVFINMLLHSGVS